MSIINGYKEPRIRVFDAAGILTETIDLDLTDSKGLVESYEIKSVTHRLIDYSTLQKIEGYIINFTLHYEGFADGQLLLRLKKILDYALAGYRLELVPRKDFLWRKFEVFVSSDGFELALGSGYDFAKGHKLPVIRFTTKYLQKELPWSEIGDTFSGTGISSPMEGEYR